MIRNTLLNLMLIGFAASIAPAEESKGPADLIVHHGKVITVDAKFRIAEAVAVKDGRILAVGDNNTILKLKGPATRLIDVGGRDVLPGLYDSHVHSIGAAVSELHRPL